MPPGTVVEDPETRRPLGPAGRRPARGRCARRRRAGAATSSSPTATRQSPRFAEQGLPGEERWLELRLKLLADAGLVGLPNAGKSSLLARLTRAQPKVADYPFTTIEPVLGTLEASRPPAGAGRHPGLIEGASGGAGLGHEFLAHVERCRAARPRARPGPARRLGPGANHATVEAELARARSRPRGAAAHPLPLEGGPGPGRRGRRRGRLVARAARAAGCVVHLGGHGRGPRGAPRRHLRAACRPSRRGGATRRSCRPTHRVYRPGADDAFRVERLGDGAFRVRGSASSACSPGTTWTTRRRSGTSRSGCERWA